MLWPFFKPGSCISQEQLCLKKRCRAKMILAGTFPGDCCPHRPLMSSVLNILPLVSSWWGSWSLLWHQAYPSGDWGRLWTWGQGWKSKVFGQGWTTGQGPSDTNLPPCSEEGAFPSDCSMRDIILTDHRIIKDFKQVGISHWNCAFE